MKSPVTLSALLLFAATAVAQPPDRTALYSTPSVPGTAALERLNLQMVWTNVILTDGKRDGLLSVQFAPVREGGKVKMRLLHNFHIRDGMITKEIGYEVWRRDE